MAKRTKTGQSMVEYALGIGCVTALMLVALNSVGHFCGPLVVSAQHAISYTGAKRAI